MNKKRSSIWASLDLDVLPDWPVVWRAGDTVHYQASLALKVGHPVIVLGPDEKLHELREDMFFCACKHCGLPPPASRSSQPP